MLNLKSIVLSFIMLNQPSRESLSSATELPPSQQKQTQSASAQKALAVIKPYRSRNGWKAVAAIINNYVVFIACVTAGRWLSNRYSTSPTTSGTIYLVAILVIASRMRALENLVHEASHNNLFSSPRLHQRLEFLYAFPVFRLLKDYRRSHLMHHKHLGDPLKHPDLVQLYILGLDCLPERPLWCLFGIPLTGFLTYQYLRTTFYEFWESRSSRFSKTVFWITIALVVVYTATLHLFVYYYLVPLLVILPTIRYWAEVSEHLGLDLRADFGNSRTNIGFVHRWYLNPHNDGYHSVHHLCSQIPFHLLPEAHEHLMKESREFATNSVISHGIIETFMWMATKVTVVK